MGRSEACYSSRSEACQTNEPKKSVWVIRSEEKSVSLLQASLSILITNIVLNILIINTVLSLLCMLKMKIVRIILDL